MEYIEIKGKVNTAICYAKVVEDEAIEQIRRMCDYEMTEGSKIRIMPDVHSGKGCTIGFTADLGEMVIPNIVGVDIGCGMLCVKLGKTEIDFEVFDQIVRQFVPCGRETHAGRLEHSPALQTMHCYRNLKHSKRIERSLGTLGGGNHFIELDKDEEGCVYLVIHTGSRNLGKQVAEYYQSLAYDIARGVDHLLERQKQLIEDYKAQGRRNEIQAAIVQMKKEYQFKESEIPIATGFVTSDGYFYTARHVVEPWAYWANIESLNPFTLANILFQMGATIDATIEAENNIGDKRVMNYSDFNVVRKNDVTVDIGDG